MIAEIQPFSVVDADKAINNITVGRRQYAITDTNRINMLRCMIPIIFDFMIDFA